jgi:hypothetical protein
MVSDVNLNLAKAKRKTRVGGTERAVHSRSFFAAGVRL